MCLSKRSGIRASLATMGVATLLFGCGSATGSGAKTPDAATPATGGNGGINSNQVFGTGGMSTGGATSPGTGGVKLDAGLPTGGTGTGGVGTGGVHLDANPGTGGMIDAPSTTGGGGGTTGIGTGGITGSGGASGMDARTPVLDGKVLACDEIPGPCTSTSLSNYSTPAVTSTTEYFYDDHGRLVRQTSTSSNGSTSTYFYAYDHAGRQIEAKSDSCDTANRYGCDWHTYTYDDEGHLLMDNDKGNSASVQPGCTRYTYNGDGLLVRREFFAGCGTTSYDGAVTYEYDSAKRLVAEHSTKEEFLGTSSSIAYQYDSANQVIGESYTNKTGSVTATKYLHAQCGWPSPGQGNPLRGRQRRPDHLRLQREGYGADTQDRRLVGQQGNQVLFVHLRQLRNEQADLGVLGELRRGRVNPIRLLVRVLRRPVGF